MSFETILVDTTPRVVTITLNRPERNNSINGALLRELVLHLGPRTLATTAAYGVPVGDIEALAFAWLARESLAGRPGNLPAVTGARGPRVLGAIYPA